jgi:hypothetical protein
MQPIGSKTSLARRSYPRASLIVAVSETCSLQTWQAMCSAISSLGSAAGPALSISLIGPQVAAQFIKAAQ